MRALQFKAYGGPEVLEWAEAPEPHPGPSQLRIAFKPMHRPRQRIAPLPIAGHRRPHQTPLYLPLYRSTLHTSQRLPHIKPQL